MRPPLLLLLLLPLLLVHAHAALCLRRIAWSAGANQAWWAWLPLLNLLLPLKIARRSLWWSLLLPVPAVNFIVWALVWAEVCEALGRPPWFGIVMSVPGVNLAVLARIAGWRWRALAASLTLIAASLSLAAHAYGGDRREAAEQGRAASVRALLDAARGLGGSELPDVRIVDALATFGPAAVPELIAALQDGDAGVRWHAAAGLMRLGASAAGAAPALFEAMRDEQWVVRNAAGRALEEVARSEDIPELARALGDPSAETRYHVARALGRQGRAAAAAVPALVEALRDRDADVRIEAGWALGSVGSEGEAAIPGLIDALKDSDPQVRAIAVWGLGAIGARGPEAAGALRDVLKEEENRDVREAAGRALRKIEDRER